MYVLIVPMYSHKEINGDSTYVIYTAWVRAVKRLRPNWTFYILFPQKGSGYKYDDDGFFSQPGVIRIPWRLSTRKTANAVSYDGIFFDNLLRYNAIDIVWNNLVECTGHIAHAGHGTNSLNEIPGVIATHNYVIHKSLAYGMDGIENILAQQLHGALFADANVFISKWCRQMLMDNACEYLAAKQIARIQKTSSVIQLGIIEDALTPAAHNGAVPVVAYNHRLQHYKRPHETFGVLDKLWKAGVRFRVIITGTSTDHLGKFRHYPFVEVKLCKDRASYLSVLRQCDLNVTSSSHETFCIAAAESMALGQPLIAPASATFPEITGVKETRYPYLYKTEAEREAYLQKLLTDGAERKKWGSVLSKYVRDNFSQSRWAERYVALIEAIDRQKAPNSQHLGLIKQAVKQAGSASLRDVYRAVTSIKNSEGGYTYSAQSLSMVKLARLLRMVDGVTLTVRGTEQWVGVN